MSDKKIRWGIISTANIGMKQVIPGIMASEHSVVTAIASRNLASAQAAAKQLGIEKAYGSYEAMLADPDIDAVYNPLPNHLHVDLTLQAAKAGKHILCEKPMALDVADAMRLLALPKDILVTEAFMVRHHPQWQRALEIVKSGELGTLRAINVVFSYYNDDPNNVRNQADIGGGAILDIGCYAVTAGRYFFQAEPNRIVSLIDRDPKFQTDRTVSAVADFGNGQHLNFMVSTQLVGSQRVEILGTKARLEIVIPFNAPANQATALIIDHAITNDGSLVRKEIIDACDQYTLQAENFALAILGKKPLTYSIDDAIKSMKILEALVTSEKTNGWVTI
ncbi:MAG: Gfo/Idh/MocA family oxidoreductase [Rhizobiales bacterium]|nr:Gfo/Idh/MocA family oxidoreductase [Hyphomicrobiales bacterium]NRB13629.1 Gfo/Idh/MocA family oxidoreductase [Hyphomicrobiales bacterium]